MKVISGGQNGVDQAALRAAKDCGLATGGWLPPGCQTLDGPRPDLLTEYGMKEHARNGYPPRTEANVREADCTLRLARSFSSAGERCTLNAIRWCGRPYLDVVWKVEADPAAVAEWLRQMNPQVLNVAGNSEVTAPGIGQWAYMFLRRAFELYGEKP